MPLWQTLKQLQGWKDSLVVAEFNRIEEELITMSKPPPHLLVRKELITMRKKKKKWRSKLSPR
jgi:hypothetical protein